MKDLKIWQKGIKIGKETYNLTKEFPSEEKFGLVNQLNRAAVSISPNIAEGSNRRSEKDLIIFLLQEIDEE